MAEGNGSAEATERSPLLRDEEQNANGAHDGAPNGAASTDDAVLAEEPSTKKLLAIMSAMWLGSFFAALGNTRANLQFATLTLTIQIPLSLRPSQRPYPLSLIPYRSSPGLRQATSLPTLRVSLSAESLQTYLAAEQVFFSPMSSSALAASFADLHSRNG